MRARALTQVYFLLQMTHRNSCYEYTFRNILYMYVYVHEYVLF
jgi:hypothetical protein